MVLQQIHSQQRKNLQSDKIFSAYHEARSCIRSDLVETYLLEKLQVFESVVGDANVKDPPRIEACPPAFQAIPRNPIILDLAYNYIDFPSLENRTKKDKKGSISRLWR